MGEREDKWTGSKGTQSKMLLVRVGQRVNRLVIVEEKRIKNTL